MAVLQNPQSDLHSFTVLFNLSIFSIRFLTLLTVYRISTRAMTILRGHMDLMRYLVTRAYHS